jgi:hypothetical protein
MSVYYGRGYAAGCVVNSLFYVVGGTAGGTGPDSYLPILESYQP